MARRRIKPGGVDEEVWQKFNDLCDEQKIGTDTDAWWNVWLFFAEGLDAKEDVRNQR